jgi:hypothetical protein
MDAKTANSSLLDDFLSEPELAIELRISERTAQRYRQLGIGPPYVMRGPTPFYPRPGAKQWLADGGTAGVKRGRSRGRSGG